MRRVLKEGLIVGVGIGLAVVLIRTLGVGASENQILALILAGLALIGLQLLLSLRHAARQRPPDTPPERSQRTPPGLRPKARDPFAHESNRSWTGLQPTSAEPNDDQEPWGAPRKDWPDTKGPQE